MLSGLSKRAIPARRQGPAPGNTPKAPPASCCLTVDVEAWFHAHNLRIPAGDWDRWPDRVNVGIDRILQLLEEHGITGTFFVLGYVARRCPGIVRRLHDLGHEIASHGWNHEHLNVMSPKEFRADIERSKKTLEDLVQLPVVGYRAPRYSITPANVWALDVLEETGFKYDSSIYPVRAPHRKYGFAGSPLRPHLVRPGLLECPLPTVSLGGYRLPALTGAYLRVYPYQLSRFALRQNRSRGVPVVFNLHPWELDPGQPRVDAPFRHRLTHYHRLDATADRVGSLMRNCPFQPMGRLAHDWTSWLTRSRSAPCISSHDQG